MEYRSRITNNGGDESKWCPRFPMSVFDNCIDGTDFYFHSDDNSVCIELSKKQIQHTPTDQHRRDQKK